ncbi:TPA: hypothetical protein DD690_04805 [Candidatus Daviesbacteria bacterium]|nr:MAG: hypothetical protein US80_C0001G0041 [Candidatus Daviesbacteria bacterium GW2011_GWA2_38_17]OGE27265.1 MAG: hypothetical protein A3D02_03105 [Candidatus Daviesbacteria bacterium RIFCSPHIGHO2_02_FULL_39_41]OGE44991.1 MAG: hypothetical protein A3E67_02415 [Candidatus Daviesbacteria bacterium RIFCSPHIGHO2_12_FULL_38_25]OGE68463.1 MAG: hypothetical protein A3H81_05925 [Candidatus Daviesbacteria bacterium RIFCSPLOWO2_02_FULL_38_18]OGE73391.1 MAG: hypothetical protein A3H18_01085 [Candidatus 
MAKTILSSLFFVIIFFILIHPDVLAESAVINEFMANPSSGYDWVELYNPTTSSVDLTNWILVDSTSTMKTLSGTISAGGFMAFEVSTRLNKTSDSIYLKDSGGSTIDNYSYTTEPGADVSIGRSPDGGSWTTLASSSKGSSNGGASPSPSPTPSPSPSSASSFTISNVPSSIDSTQTFTTSITLELSSYPNTKFYLKGAFVKSGSTNYFGYTKVNDSWVKNNNTYSDQYSITTDSSGKWSGSLEIQPDVFDSGYEGTNDYIFKVGRYTSSGNGPTWSNEITIKINAKEVEMAEENINLSALSVPKSSSVLGESKKQEDLPETVYSLERYKKSASRSALATPSSKPKTKVKGERINFLIPLGAILVIIGAIPISYAIYHQFRKRNQRAS